MKYTITYAKFALMKYTITYAPEAQAFANK